MGRVGFVLGVGLFSLCVFQVPGSEAERCEDTLGESSGCPSSWTSLWYVWLILLTIFLLLVCGVLASCVKCCRKTKPQVPAFAARPYEVTVIAIENDSTIHSTVSTNGPLQYAPANGGPFLESTLPPPYSLYAIETPPPYDLALKMAKPIEVQDPEILRQNSQRTEDPSPAEEASTVTSSVAS
ncbi:transmembrane protein 52-like [Hemiscyllium ocellatum]|uniref:transmembrane protein 52-like n=1 Tax=Hemiscyllium ocellatum TaxID=170820 RepID=UPI00296610F2|nr:transmembrane protein 52-like [Hemiscyllium ocellatum]